MPPLPSQMVPIGTPCPGFSLPDVVSGKSVRLEDLKAKRALLVMFICNHCPFVKHIRDQLAALGRDYLPKGAAIVGICSNDVLTHPADGPEAMAAEARSAGYTFPYLHDESQSVARAFDAACTPDFFLYGPDRTLVYRGQLDESRPNNGIPVTGKDLRAALDAVLAGRAPSSIQIPSIGCSIKWKPAEHAAS